MDVEVEKVTEEVQKGLENMSDWTLKQWESKSPMNKKRNKKGDVKTDIALNYIQFPTKESYTPL